jgi:hypothetical protein
LGDKGFVAGRVGKNYCDARFIRACRRRYFRLEADMTGLFSTQEAYGEVRRRLPAEPGEDLVQVELTGELPSGAMLDREGLARLLGRDFYYAGVTDRTRAELPREKELAENSLRGIFVRKMLERIAASKDEEEARVLELALRCGSAALLGGEVEEL